MVVPIFPNTQFSSEKRPPVRPSGRFPFSRCFHWIDNLTNIRVRRRHDRQLFDDAHAASLNGQQHVAIQMAFSDDYDRAEKSLLDDSASDDDASSSSSSAEGSTSSRASSVRSIPPDALDDPKVRQACCPLDPPPSYTSSGASEAPVPPQSNDSSRCHAVRRPATPDSEEKQSIVEDISGLNLFGWDIDPTVPLIPLVDLWLELEEHICAEDIPSPVDWHKEEEEIVS